MKFSNIKYLILSSALLLGSCSKYLDHEPDMRAEINSVDKVKRLLTSAYPFNNYLTITETYSDNVEDKMVGDLYLPIPKLYFWDDVVDNSADGPTAYWNASYEAIAAANHALAAIDKYKMGEEANPYKGEALISRAYNHFMLACFFAKVYDRAPNAANNTPGVPYVTEPETITLKKYDRGTVKSVFENIRKDLEQGLALLDAGGGNWSVPKFHFTPAAAHAFATRFYLFTGEYQKVVDNANKIFASGNFSGKLIPYNSVFRKMDFESVKIAFNKPEQPYILLMNETYSSYPRWNSRYGMGVNVFQNIYNGVTATGAKFYNFGVSYGAPHYTTYIWNGYWYTTDQATGSGYPMLMVPVLVTDEVLMNRAEAYLELGNTTAAITDMNLMASNRIDNYNPNTHAVTTEKSKEFFHVQDNKEALIQTILQFKQVGLMSMGLRWFDIIRKGITVKHNVIGNDERESFIELKPGDLKRVFQIPQEAKLSGIEQNPR